MSILHPDLSSEIASSHSAPPLVYKRLGFWKARTCSTGPLQKFSLEKRRQHVALEALKYARTYCLQRAHAWHQDTPTYLFGSHLSVTHFHCIHLYGTHLSVTHLSVSHLHLFGIHLFGNNLFGTHLSVTHLYGTHISVIHLPVIPSTFMVLTFVLAFSLLTFPLLTFPLLTFSVLNFPTEGTVKRIARKASKHTKTSFYKKAYSSNRRTLKQSC